MTLIATRFLSSFTNLKFALRFVANERRKLFHFNHLLIGGNKSIGSNKRFTVITSGCLKLLMTDNQQQQQQVRRYRFTPTMASNDPDGVDGANNDDGNDNCDSSRRGHEPFQPKKALVLTKFSRYEFEKLSHPELSENELQESLKSRGSDYNNLVSHHGIHIKSRDHVMQLLQEYGIEPRLVNRFDYTDANINWADVIITTGGDGTFLMAASKVHERDKPVIGVNSDPSRSVGYLCLPSRYSNNFGEALKLLKSGQFKWTFRQRIRVSLQGEHAFEPPVELHNQQLPYPEFRYLDLEPHHLRKTQTTSENSTGATQATNGSHTLPVRALNEVFVGESLSSRVSYYEISTNGSPRVKVKSSGLTICTGTGSTSWSFNINKVTPQCVQNLFNIVNEETGLQVSTDDKFLQKVTDRFNSTLIFDVSKPVMGFTIRDPVVFGTDFNSNPRGFANKIEVRSRMFEASIVIDGGLSYIFNDGCTANFEILEEDALRTVTLPP